jgi:hypothetical protein
MQRGHAFGHKILAEMVGKMMVESASSLNLEWGLSPIVRSDIENVFRDDQYRLEFEALFAEQRLDR